MKKVLSSDLHCIHTIANPSIVYGILRESSRAITTYNQLMRHYEDGHRDIAVVFVTPRDDVLFIHIPLFCKHFGIRLYALPDDAKDVLKSIYGMKHVNIIGLYKDDVSHRQLKALDLDTHTHQTIE